MTLYKEFPPGWGHLRIPTSSRRAALAGLALYAACRPRALLAQRAAWACIKLLGPGALAGRSSPWTPIDTDSWRELSEVWRKTLGPFDAVAGYQRLLGSRGGLGLLLLRAGVPVAFVKVRPDARTVLEHEARVTEAAWRFAPRSFMVPEPLHLGTAGGWSFFAVRPLPPRLHRVPRRPPLDAIVQDIEGALSELQRPAEVPAHWRAMHGDFTPWNLRCVGAQALVLIDWEEAGWGPPGADAVLYRASQSAIDGTAPARATGPEAVHFWRERIARRPGTPRDKRLDEALLWALGQMDGAQ